jgi:hypothetical protein
MPATEETLTTADARPEALAPASSKPLEILGREPVEIAMRDMLGGSGVVDERIQPSPGRRRRDDPLAILIARHIALHDHHLAALFAAEIGGLFGVLLARGIVDDDARPTPGENGGSCRPQTGRRTRHDRAQTILRHAPSLSFD